MNFDKKDFIIIVLIFIILWLFKIEILQDNSSKDLVTHIKQNKSVKKVELKVDDSISNRNKPETKFLPDFETIDKEFYLNLKNCTPIELATKSEIEYSIYGFQNNKCSFQHRMDFYVLDCNLPADINKKYAEEGIKISQELENLRLQNKTGFVHAGEYITDINNNSGYCSSYSTYTKHKRNN